MQTPYSFWLGFGSAKLAWETLQHLRCGSTGGSSEAAYRIFHSLSSRAHQDKRVCHFQAVLLRVSARERWDNHQANLRGFCRRQATAHSKYGSNGQYHARSMGTKSKLERPCPRLLYEAWTGAQRAKRRSTMAIANVIAEVFCLS